MKASSDYCVKKKKRLILLPLPARHAQDDEIFRTKETFSVCLFIPVLPLYLFTPVTLLFSSSPSLHLALPCGFLSHTASVMVLQPREKDLGDHLKPIMAALQPPRNSVTDGDLVFIAGVIGNTQTRTHSTRKYKEIDTFKCSLS